MKNKKEEEIKITPVDPVELQNVPETEPPQRQRKARKDKGKPRKKKFEEKDFELPLKIILIGLTKSIADSSNNPAWLMTDSEAQAIEIGFNKWQVERVPQLEKFAPEIYLAVPILAYIIRVRISKPIQIPSNLVEAKVHEMPDVEANEYKPDLKIDKKTGNPQVH